MYYIKGESSKNGFFTVRLTVSVDPPPPTLGSFFFVIFLPYIMMKCFLKRILLPKQAIFIQLLESPIPP